MLRITEIQDLVCTQPNGSVTYISTVIYISHKPNPINLLVNIQSTTKFCIVNESVHYIQSVHYTFIFMWSEVKDSYSVVNQFK